MTTVHTVCCWILFLLLVSFINSQPCVPQHPKASKTCIGHFTKTGCEAEKAMDLSVCKWRRCCHAITKEAQKKCGDIKEQHPKMCFHINNELKTTLKNKNEQCIWDCTNDLVAMIESGYYKSVHFASYSPRKHTEKRTKKGAKSIADKLELDELEIISKIKNSDYLSAIQIGHTDPMGVSYTAILNAGKYGKYEDQTEKPTKRTEGKRRRLPFDGTLFRRANTRPGGANQDPFSSTVYIQSNILPAEDTDPLTGTCVGSVIHNIEDEGTWIITAGHCCVDFRTGLPQYDFVVSYSCNTDHADGCDWDLYGNPTLYYPQYTRTTRTLLSSRADWCVMRFGFAGLSNGGGSAPHSIAIKFDTQFARQENVLMSTYWTEAMDPPNPVERDHFKRYLALRANSDPKHPQAYFTRAVTAGGQSGSPIVEDDTHFRNIRAILTGNGNGVEGYLHHDYWTKITKPKYDLIVQFINGWIDRQAPGEAHIQSTVVNNADGTPISGVAGASVNGYNEYYEYNEYNEYGEYEYNENLLHELEEDVLQAEDILQRLQRQQKSNKRY